MPTQIVNILIEKVDALAATCAELKTDVKWLKETSAGKADVTWLKKGTYLIVGAALSWAAYHIPK